MPLGHNWTPIVRVTPPAGAAYTVTLSGLAWNTITQPSYEGLSEIKEMLTFAVRKVKRGFRVHVHQEFEFFTPTADETTLAEQVITPACDPDNEYLIELSLDGGTTYRAVDLEDHQRVPIEGKNIGVRHSIDWVCQEPIASLPAVGSGAW
jgi:hypothetical protein